jgi:phytoene synthase
MEDAPPPATDLAGFARAHDPDRFLCALFAPAARRGAIFALIAFNHELARAREATTNPVAALIRLQWWRDAVEEAAAGKPARRHEVATPLAAAIQAGLLDPAGLLAMADAREAEAEEDGLATEAAFVAWLRGTAGGWSGAAYGLAGVLRSVPAHAAQGRCLLPRDRLHAAGLAAEAVVADPAAPALRALVADMAAEGLAALEGARRDIPAGAIAAALPVVLAARDLKRLAAGRPVPAPRGFGDRAAVVWAGLRGLA